MRKRVHKICLLMLVVAYLLVGYSTAFAVERVYILPATTNEKAPKSNVFQLKGSNDKFILLDHTDEGYFVLSQKIYATKYYSIDGTPVAFDPKNPNSLAYWLNNDFITDKTLSKRLPDAIIENLVERTYQTEGGGKLVPFGSSYTSTCKVVVLSQTEWSTYNAKFGYGDDTSSTAWWLRSVRELTGTPLVAYTSGSNGGLTHEGRWTSSLGVRPAFYLPNDFFEKVSIDVENTGDAVLSVIRKEYDKSTLDLLYNSSELYTLTETDIAPMANAVSVVGRGIVGEAITGSYSFISLDNKAESGTAIQWQRSFDGEIWSTILGAESSQYVPTTADIGYHIRMRISPMTDSMAGASYTSSPLSCTIRPISTPVANNVRISATEQIRPGTILTAKFSFSDENRDISNGTEYVWESSYDKVSSEKIGSSKYLRLSNNDGGKYVRVGIIPKKKTNSASGRQTITGNIAYSEWIYVENLPAVTDVNIIRSGDLSISLSKTDKGVTVSGSISTLGNKAIEKLTAVYNIDRNDDYTVVCEWQGSDSETGEYTLLTSGTDSLEYVPAKTMWVRAKVYTKNAQGVSKATTSAPMFIGNGKYVEEKGEFSITRSLSANKSYEVWISAKASDSSAFSFRMDGIPPESFTSDNYFIGTVQDSGSNYVMGTLISGKFTEGAYIKAGEIKLSADANITISDALTATFANGGIPVTQARVFIVEK